MQPQPFLQIPGRGRRCLATRVPFCLAGSPESYQNPSGWHLQPWLLPRGPVPYRRWRPSLLLRSRPCDPSVPWRGSRLDTAGVGPCVDRSVRHQSVLEAAIRTVSCLPASRSGASLLPDHRPQFCTRRWQPVLPVRHGPTSQVSLSSPAQPRTIAGWPQTRTRRNK